MISNMAGYEVLIDELLARTRERGEVLERVKAKAETGELADPEDPIHAELDTAIDAAREVEDRIRAFVRRHGRQEQLGT
jgi:hypothetical protein